MMRPIIGTKNLSYSYHNVEVLNNLNLAIPEGAIYGYLGKNGAGKTTTLKLLLGLLPCSSDTVFVKNIDIHKHNEKLFHQIGNLIESPSLYKSFTCYEQLKYIDYFYKKGNKAIEHTLEQIGLLKERDKKIKNLSTGMKQRLGIGISLFHNPDILILDEPINGLDPNGVFEVRELLQKLNKEGKTIILSSHILSEIEKLCNHVGIINNGNLIYQGGIKDLLNVSKREITVTTSSFTNDIITDDNLEFICRDENTIIFTINSDVQYAKMIKLLVSKDICIYNVENNIANLENIYMNLTLNNYDK